MVPTTPSDTLGSASGTLGLGNCLFQTCWSGLRPRAQAPAEILAMAVPQQGETEGGTQAWVSDGEEGVSCSLAV